MSLWYKIKNKFILFFYGLSIAQIESLKSMNDYNLKEISKWKDLVFKLQKEASDERIKHEQIVKLQFEKIKKLEGK